ncbi:IclR family transcriptional regulator [Pseudarthrobacter sp. H2]|uniref:IclR family transcriptional regulator n=1 Tax=Pseudarthrobacter sp. H2 TaxID=3418415 RepID=UPI003CE7AC55
MDMQAAAEDEVQASDDAVDLTNKSVVKATVLLSELGRHRKGITVTELAQAVGMSRPTAFRLLLSLEQTGFVDRVDNRYLLGWQMARLGRLADPYAGAVARIQPIMDEYAAKLNETISFAMVRNKTTYDVIAEASGSRYLNASHLYVGMLYPAHASATGKLLLAELSDDEITATLPEKLESYTAHTITDLKTLLQEIREVRKQGYAVIDDELEEGLFAAAYPVRDGTGGLIGILAVQGPTQRLKSDKLPGAINLLRQAAVEIAKVLA